MSDNNRTGYKNPPKDKQFKRGQSGNPNGRPRQPKTFDEFFDKTLMEKVTVTENGKKREITRMELIVLQTTNAAVKGEARCRKIVIEHAKKMRVEEKFVQTTDDVAAYANFLRKVKGESNES